MRRRSNRVWVLAYAFTLAVLLAVVYHPHFGHNPATGMSAPSAPRTAIDSGSPHTLLRAQLDGTGAELPASDITFTTPTCRFQEYVARGFSGSRNYGPLHQRPPPSLS